MGGDYMPLPKRRFIASFQSTPPHGGRLLFNSALQTSMAFQSTPPHGGRPLKVVDRLAPAKVSIHAPAWGATIKKNNNTVGTSKVSIHAPAWGATKDLITNAKIVKGFNPRPRMGGDAVRMDRSDTTYEFQSTPPHGGRPSRIPSVIST